MMKNQNLFNSLYIKQKGDCCNMDKYKSVYISTDDLNIQTDWYLDEQYELLL